MDDLPQEVMAVQVKTCAVEQEYDLDYDVRMSAFPAPTDINIQCCGANLGAAD